MHVQISWLLQKPTDLDLHCLQRQGISGFSRTRVTHKSTFSEGNKYCVFLPHLNAGKIDLKPLVSYTTDCSKVMVLVLAVRVALWHNGAGSANIV